MENTYTVYSVSKDKKYMFRLVLLRLVIIKFTGGGNTSAVY